MKTNFRKQIKELLQAKGIKVPELSRMVDLNQQTIYNYLREDNPSEMTACNVEKILNTLEK